MTDPILLLIALAAITLWFLFRPGRGLWSRWRQARAVDERIQGEDALKHLYNCEFEGRAPTVDGLAGALHLTRDAAVALLGRLEADGLVQVAAGRIELTTQGQTAAVHIIRAHRLWERYLAEETGFQREEWHARAERQEHHISPEEADRLAAALGNPTHDPHGDPIPTASGDLHDPGGQPLSAAPLDVPLRVVHVEDEPEIVYAQLVAESIHPGMVVRVVESTPERVRLLSQGDEHVLAPMVAVNVTVVPLPDPAAVPAEPGAETLARLQLGEAAEVVNLSPACRGDRAPPFPRPGHPPRH